MDLKNKVLVAGYSKVNEKSAILKMFSNFCLVFIIDKETHIISGVDATVTLKGAREFIENMFINEVISNEIKIKKKIDVHYHGPLRKAIFVAYKNALRKYLDISQLKSE